MSRYDDKLANIDFSNPEDIFDYSSRLSSEEENDCYITHYSAPLDYSKVPRKLIAEPYMKLSDLQSITNCSYNNYREVVHCAHCGNGFIYPTQQNNSTGEQIYYCPNCQVNFSRHTVPTQAEHVPCHQTDKMHCCVCGQAYQDLARFIYHCQSHDESEYHKVCTNKQPVTSQPQNTVGPPPLVAIPTNESMQFSNNGGYDEANITIVNNPIYSSNAVFPLVNYNTVSLLLPHSSSYCLSSHDNQIVYPRSYCLSSHDNQMVYHSQMALQHFPLQHESVATP